METETRNFLKYVILPLVLLSIAVFIAWRQSWPDFLLHLSSYEGNAVLVETHMGRQIIFSGSNADGLLKNIGRDMPFFDRSIDLLILTKADLGAISAAQILKRYKVDLILMPELGSTAGSYQEFLKLAAKNQIPVKYLKANQKIGLDNSTVLQILEVDKFAASLDFGSVHINLPQDLPVGGEFISDGVTLYKN